MLDVEAGQVVARVLCIEDVLVHHKGLRTRSVTASEHKFGTQFQTLARGAVCLPSYLRYPHTAEHYRYHRDILAQLPTPTLYTATHHLPQGCKCKYRQREHAGRHTWHTFQERDRAPHV